MPIKTGFRKAGKVEIDGSLSPQLLWTSFSFERTSRTDGRRFYRELILNNTVSFSLPGPRTHRALVEQIAKQSATPIAIESLSEDLNQVVLPRGRTVSGFSGNYLDQIARHHKLTWWISKNGLNIQRTDDAALNISAFDEQAGRSMWEARSRRLSNGYLSSGDYVTVVTDLAAAGFTLRDGLEGRCRKRLVDWNQKNPRNAVKTLKRAIDSRIPWLHRGLKKRLYRAVEKYRKAHPELVPAF